MKLLLTLDFEPEYGGIQRYLADIVRHSYTSNDLVFTATSVRSKFLTGFPCTVRNFNNPAITLFKKTALLSFFFPVLKLILFGKKNITIECGNIYSALLPFFLRLDYNVYTFGTELVSLKGKYIRTLLFLLILKKAGTVYTLGHYSFSLLKQFGIQKQVTFKPPKIVIPKNVVTKKSSEMLHFLSVGRLVEHKGHDLLLDAFKRVDLNQNFKLTIAGNGPEKEKLQKKIAHPKLVQTVELKTNLSDKELQKEYLLADIFILSSRESTSGTEGFGIVLLEAMAYKTAIIASSSGGIPEVVDYDNCARLFDPKNICSLVDAIEVLGNNPAIRNHYINSAEKHLRRYYVWEE
ncbi:glycosyltransferase [Chitinispirillales bacterium ANBcel5]|uniref:glycosyltransferase n=1 Tax=Cellulosispirillum alkaliphilum TaxID=3039283 RepID=UPI002A54DF78|nr:glycosyltransferase [Chitinispirillales bacterium ANBcel5]